MLMLAVGLSAGDPILNLGEPSKSTSSKSTSQVMLEGESGRRAGAAIAPSGEPDFDPTSQVKLDREFALRVLNSLTHGDTEYDGLKVSLSESSLPLYLLRHQTTLGPLGLV